MHFSCCGCDGCLRAPSPNSNCQFVQWAQWQLVNVTPGISTDISCCSLLWQYPIHPACVRRCAVRWTVSAVSAYVNGQIWFAFELVLMWSTRNSIIWNSILRMEALYTCAVAHTHIYLRYAYERNGNCMTVFAFSFSHHLQSARSLIGYST